MRLFSILCLSSSFSAQEDTRKLYGSYRDLIRGEEYVRKDLARSSSSVNKEEIKKNLLQEEDRNYDLKISELTNLWNQEPENRRRKGKKKKKRKKKPPPKKVLPYETPLNKRPNDIKDVRLGHMKPTTKISYLQQYGRNCGKTQNDFFGGMFLESDNYYGGNGIDRIINGETTDIINFPWQVVFFFQKANRFDINVPFCGGTIISHDWIMTAAHCVRGLYAPKLRIYANVSHTDDESLKNGHYMEVDYWVVHADYKPLGANKNDVALVKVKSKHTMNFGHGIFPACLPDNHFCLKDQTSISVSGFGTTDKSEIGRGHSKELKYAQVPILSKSTCAKQNITTDFEIDISYENEFCAGNGSKDACTGDSGGPIVYKDPETRVTTLIGAVSWGYGCAEVGFPGIYAKMSQFTHWIAQMSGIYIDGMDYSKGLSDCEFDQEVKMPLHPQAGMHNVQVSLTQASLTDTETGEINTTKAPLTIQTSTLKAPETMESQEESKPYVAPSKIAYSSDPFPEGRVKIGQRCVDPAAGNLKSGFYAYISKINDKNCWTKKIHSKRAPKMEYTPSKQIQIIKRGKGKKTWKYCLAHDPSRIDRHLIARSNGWIKDIDADLLRWMPCDTKASNQKWLVEEKTRFMRPLEDPNACFTFFEERTWRSYAKLTNVPDKCATMQAYKETVLEKNKHLKRSQREWDAAW